MVPQQAEHKGNEEGPDGAGLIQCSVSKHCIDGLRPEDPAGFAQISFCNWFLAHSGTESEQKSFVKTCLLKLFLVESPTQPKQPYPKGFIGTLPSIF